MSKQRMRILYKILQNIKKYLQKCYCVGLLAISFHIYITKNCQLFMVSLSFKKFLNYKQKIFQSFTLADCSVQVDSCSPCSKKVSCNCFDSKN